MDRTQPNVFSKSPGTTSSVTKANEASRLVRCKHCGWICDKERDVRLKDGSFAGKGINTGSQRVAQSYDRYYGSKLVPLINVLKNADFTQWSGGVNPTDPITADYWATEETDGTVGRTETENTEDEYCQMSVTVDPD